MDKMQVIANAVKIGVTGFFTWLSLKLGILGPVLLVLGIVMICDYISGLMASYKESKDNPEDITKGWSSKKGLTGILKKVGYLLIIGCAMALDWLVLTLAGQFGLAIPVTTFFGILVAVWFVLNEMLSIIENIGRMGVAMPGFLKQAVAAFKGLVEKQGDSDAELTEGKDESV